jgi:hypothetical protein
MIALNTGRITVNNGKRSKAFDDSSQTIYSLY